MQGSRCLAQGKHSGSLSQHAVILAAGLPRRWDFSISSTCFPKSHLPSHRSSQENGPWKPSSLHSLCLAGESFSARAGCSKDRLPTGVLVWRESVNGPQSWQGKTFPFHLLPFAQQTWLPSALPWLLGLLPALFQVSLGHQGGSEDSSGALEPSEGARKSDTLV